MAEKVSTEKDVKKDVKTEKVLILGFYQEGDEVEVVSNTNPWVERDLGDMLLKRSQTVLGTLLDTVLKERYTAEVKG